MSLLPTRNSGLNTRVLSHICNQPWAITEEWLQAILTIAARENPSIEAVEAQMGKPLDNTHDVTVRDGIATIPVDGPLFRYADMFTKISGATSIEMLATDLETAVKDPKVRGIVLYVDSPGGEVNGTSEFADMVYAARGQKPIIAYVSNQACSAAYWIASGADQVVIADTAMVGSIGVIAAVSDPAARNAKDIEFVSSQSPNKNPDPNTEGGKAQIQLIVDDLADVFIAGVARNRNITPEQVMSDFGQGGVFVGQKAIDAGLADAIGTYEGVLSELSPRPATFPQIAASRSSKMTKFSDWLTGKAQEDGVEFDSEDLAALGGSEKIKALEAANRAESARRDSEIAKRDAEIASLKAAQETYAAQFAAAAVERRHAEAVTFSQNLVSAHRLTPAAAEALVPLAERISALDTTATFAEGEKSAQALLAEFAGSLTDLSMFTTEHVNPGQAAALFNVTKTAGVSKDDPPSDERINQLLSLLPDGQKIVAERNGKR